MQKYAFRSPSHRHVSDIRKTGLPGTFCGQRRGLSDVGVVEELAAGPLFRFADWPNDLLPRRTAGVYTVGRANDFLYVGMSGRGAQREDLVADSGQDSAKGRCAHYRGG
jgi:hypothetical protein